MRHTAREGLVYFFTQTVTWSIPLKEGVKIFSCVVFSMLHFESQYLNSLIPNTE